MTKTQQEEQEQENEENHSNPQKFAQNHQLNQGDNGVEVEDEDIFHESLDRILSSANSSTSNSDDDDVFLSGNHRRHRRAKPSLSFPKFPISSDSFSLSSLDQRRDRLLRALGLSSDPSLSRRKPPILDNFGRSGRVVSGSKSGESNYLGGDQCNSSTFGSVISICSDTVHSNTDLKYSGGGGVDNVMGNGYTELGSGSNMLVRNDGVDRVCRIKNLDNGKEFVVNEVKEDGVWGKVKEVGTDRQLTMEEFEMSVGHSPIVHELMRRQHAEDQRENVIESNGSRDEIRDGDYGSRSKKKISWLKSIKNVANSVTGFKERRSSDEKDMGSERGGRRSSSATDDSHEGSFIGSERVRVRQYGKSVKDLTALYKTQEIKAHNGSIWSIKFSVDGRYLASAGEDGIIHVWQVVESERKGELLMDVPNDGNPNMLFLTNESHELKSVSQSVESLFEKKWRSGRTSVSRKSVSLDHLAVPEMVFALSEQPMCSFHGHSDVVLDLSWSKSQLLLSSSMDKTVRLWNLSSKTCVKIFTHSDYVTCIQFNPVDDNYFISGSLDAKVRIWSVPGHQVVDWNDLHEMVTAACYTPDGQGALVGSYKGSCRLYSTSENKLQLKSLINLQNKKKRSHLKKITGFQFAPGSSSEVLVTSADSRVRVISGVDLVHKFKGFRNTNSQISGSLTANGKYMVSASEDSHVYLWKLDGDSRSAQTKGVTVTHSYEYFHCQGVSVAIPWPGKGESWPEQNGSGFHLDEAFTANNPPTPVEEFNCGNTFGSRNSSDHFHGVLSSAPSNYFFDKISATWPEEKLVLATKDPEQFPPTKSWSPCVSLDYSNGVLQNTSAWGMVIITASIRGEIKTYQNFGVPVRL